MLGWALFVLQVGELILSVMYFALLPTIFSAGLTVLLGWAAFQTGRLADAVN